MADRKSSGGRRRRRRIGAVHRPRRWKPPGSMPVPEKAAEVGGNSRQPPFLSPRPVCRCVRDNTSFRSSPTNYDCAQNSPQRRSGPISRMSRHDRGLTIHSASTRRCQRPGLYQWAWPTNPNSKPPRHHGLADVSSRHRLSPQAVCSPDIAGREKICRRIVSLGAWDHRVPIPASIGAVIVIGRHACRSREALLWAGCTQPQFIRRAQCPHPRESTSNPGASAFARLPSPMSEQAPAVAIHHEFSTVGARTGAREGDGREFPSYLDCTRTPSLR